MVRDDPQFCAFIFRQVYPGTGAGGKLALGSSPGAAQSGVGRVESLKSHTLVFCLWTQCA